MIIHLSGKFFAKHMSRQKAIQLIFGCIGVAWLDSAHCQRFHGLIKTVHDRNFFFDGIR